MLFLNNRFFYCATRTNVNLILKLAIKLKSIHKKCTENVKNYQQAFVEYKNCDKINSRKINLKNILKVT